MSLLSCVTESTDRLSDVSDILAWCTTHVHASHPLECFNCPLSFWTNSGQAQAFRGKTFKPLLVHDMVIAYGAPQP